MASEDRFERVVETLYKAAVGDVAWVTAAALVNDVIRTTGHAVVYGDPLPRRVPGIDAARFFVGSERRQDLEDLYFREYFLRDEVNQRLYQLGDGDLAYTSDLYTEHEKKTSAAYNEFRRVHDLHHGLFLTLLGLDGCAIVWSFGNSTEPGGWGRDQVQSIKRLSPHLRQFVRVRRLMANARALGASLSDLLENRRAAIVQLDRCGRILKANDGARDILLRRDGLHEDNGVLVAANRTENAELGHMLARALPRYGLQGAGGSIGITRRKAQSPLILEVHPVRGMSRDHPTREVRVLVLIVDAEARPRADAQMVEAVLGLTPAESRVVAARTAGQSVAEIAEDLGCAESTVRTHLKRVHRKLGIRNQTELVHRVMSLEALGGSFR